MVLESLLSAKREEYWQNRLEKKCCYCRCDLNPVFKSASEKPKYGSSKSQLGKATTTKAAFVYRCEDCGTEVCKKCYDDECLPTTTTCEDCEYEGELEEYKRTSYKDDFEEYTTEVLDAMQNYTSIVDAEDAKEKTELIKRNEELQLNVLEKTKQADRKQAELEEEILTLKKNLESATNQKMKDCNLVDLHCMECGYALILEKSRICLSCGIDNEYIIKQTTREGKENIQIVFFDKAEISLLCGSCILDGEHKQHENVNYFNLKISQLSVSHGDEMNRRLSTAFDEGWDTVCEKMRQCHIPMVEVLTKRGEKGAKQKSWEEFRKSQVMEDTFVQRMIENKTNMIGYIHKYTGDMKALLAEAQTALRDVPVELIQDHVQPGPEIED